VVEYIHLNGARKLLRLSSEETLNLLEKGELKGRAPRLLSASGGYDYCTGWLIERKSFEEYLARHGRRTRRKADRQTPQVHAGVLNAASNNAQANTGF